MPFNELIERKDINLDFFKLKLFKLLVLKSKHQFTLIRSIDFWNFFFHSNEQKLFLLFVGLISGVFVVKHEMLLHDVCVITYVHYVVEASDELFFSMYDWMNFYVRGPISHHDVQNLWVIYYQFYFDKVSM